MVRSESGFMGKLINGERASFGLKPLRCCKPSWVIVKRPVCPVVYVSPAPAADAFRHLQDRQAAHRTSPGSRFQEVVSRRVYSCLQAYDAVSLLEQSVDVNVIRAWLGHVNLATTYRYAEITLRGKIAAVEACAPPVAASAIPRRSAAWRDHQQLLKWLKSL